MKLGALEARAANVTAPARMTVIDPDTQKPLLDADGKECWIEFQSPDSEAGRKLDRERQLAAVRKARSGRNLDDEDPIEIQVGVLAALATGWWFGPDAEKFSLSAARELFASPDYAWLRKAAYVWVHSEVNFIRRSSTVS